jgi:hypothetical protein
MKEAGVKIISHSVPHHNLINGIPRHIRCRLKESHYPQSQQKTTHFLAPTQSAQPSLLAGL